MKVSIIIPYKEDRGWLNEAIESVENQTYKDIELILSQGSGTVGENINKGLKKSTGELITYLCDDDLLPSKSIEDRVKGMKDFDFIHSRGVHYFSPTNVKPYSMTNPNTDFKYCLESNGIMGGSTMYKADLFKEFKFNEKLTTAEEWEFHLRLLNSGKSIGFVDRITYFYRRHKDQKSIGNLNHDYQKKRQKIKDEIKKLYSPNSGSTSINRGG